MKRFGLLFLAVFVFAAPDVSAQDADPPTRVYVSYYQVNYGDLAEWMEVFRAEWEPMLEEMVAAGDLNGYNALIHNTGGVYNFRLAMQGDQDTNFDRVNERTMGGWMERRPESFQRALGMMQAHDDEIWNIDQVNITEGAEWQFMYDNAILVDYADWPTFTQVWNDALGGVLEQARTDGLLAGWVVETHNTGSEFNWKVLLLFPTWQDIRDLQGRMMAAIPCGHPIWSYWQVHKDEIWERMPPPEAN